MKFYFVSFFNEILLAFGLKLMIFCHNKQNPRVSNASTPDPAECTVRLGDMNMCWRKSFINKISRGNVCKMKSNHYTGHG